MNFFLLSIHHIGHKVSPDRQFAIWEALEEGGKCDQLKKKERKSSEQKLSLKWVLQLIEDRRGHNSVTNYFLVAYIIKSSHPKDYALIRATLNSSIPVENKLLVHIFCHMCDPLNLSINSLVMLNL